MPINNIFEDMLTLCDGVIDQRKDDWESMSREQKIKWLNKFISENVHPVVFE